MKNKTITLLAHFRSYIYHLGADRKHKTDRERMEKLSREEKDKFQPSYDCTVFSEAPLDTTMQPDSIGSTAIASSSSSYGMTRPTSSANSVAITTHTGSSPGGAGGVDHSSISVKWSSPKTHHHQQQQPPQQHHSHHLPHHHNNVSPTVSGGDNEDFGRDSPMNSDPDVPTPIESGSDNLPPHNGWSHAHHQQPPQHLPAHHHGHHPPTSAHAQRSSSAGPTSFLGLGLNGVFSSANGVSGRPSVSPSTSFGSANGDLNGSYTRGSNGDVDPLMQLQHQPHYQPPPTSSQSPAGLAVPVILSPDSSAPVVAAWLVRNRFANYVRVFNHFSGEDLLRLSREDFVQICGLADGIRLDNALQRRHVRPRLTLYVCMENDHVYHPIYLESPSLEEFKAKLGETTGLAPEAVKEMYCQGPSGIHIFVSEQFIANIRDQSRIAVRIVKDENSAKIYVLFRILE